jgi:hypothetical protein
MDGRVLTLGVVAGLAVAGLARRASGSGNAPAGRFRKISPTPAGFVTSPLSFVRGAPLELAVRPEKKGKAEAGTGFFHVTTNLPAVLAEGRLRSRRELRAADRQGAGLGGGRSDEAADRVSMGLRLDGALRLLQMTRMMARAVHGQIAPEEALRILVRENKETLDRVRDAITARADDAPDSGLEQARVALAVAEAKVKHAPRGPALYAALQDWEGHLTDLDRQIRWFNFDLGRERQAFRDRFAEAVDTALQEEADRRQTSKVWAWWRRTIKALWNLTPEERQSLLAADRMSIAKTVNTQFWDETCGVVTAFLSVVPNRKRVSERLYLQRDAPFVNPAGFMEPAEKFARVRPEAVGLIQLAVRKDARSQQINRECEIRFGPEDLALVGVWEEK